MLCQEHTRADLECPARSTTGSVGNGYKTLAEHLILFQVLGHMPMGLSIERLDDGDGIEATMIKISSMLAQNLSFEIQPNQT